MGRVDLEDPLLVAVEFDTDELWNDCRQGLGVHP
jgi:hypothetical protein